jgi:hypothetical protein
MKIDEILIHNEETNPLVEIMTIGQLEQPTEEIINLVNNAANEPVENFSDTYAGLYGNTQLVVAIKRDDRLIAYAIGELSQNDKSEKFNIYMTPKNLYSWAKDNGNSALKVIKAMIRLSPHPVLSDIRLSDAAKKFLRRKVNTGELNGEIFNLKTGEVTPYDEDIWETDDDYRVLFMEHMGRNHINESLLMPTGTWNWSQLAVSNSRKRKFIHFH